MQFKEGTSRIVLLISNYAIKIPNIKRWRSLLHGLIANMNETKFSKINDGRLANVLFNIPGGFLIVMERCEPVKKSNKELIDFCNNGEFKIPAEIKNSSFGIIDGNLKAVDYG